MPANVPKRIRTSPSIFAWRAKSGAPAQRRTKIRYPSTHPLATPQSQCTFSLRAQNIIDVISHESDLEASETGEASETTSEAARQRPPSQTNLPTVEGLHADGFPSVSAAAVAAAAQSAILNRFDQLKLPKGTTATSLTRQHLIAAATVLGGSPPNLAPPKGNCPWSFNLQSHKSPISLLIPLR